MYDCIRSVVPQECTLTAEQVKALLRSYSEGDSEHFVLVALQIAAHSACLGKGRLAQELRDLVDEIKRKQSQQKIGGAVPITRPVLVNLPAFSPLPAIRN